MFQVIGQAVESANEQGARQLFDVLETLLIIVSVPHSFILLCSESATCRKYLFLASISLSWSISFLAAAVTKHTKLSFVS